MKQWSNWDTHRIDPRPKGTREKIDKVAWPIRALIAFSKTVPPMPNPFSKVIEARRSVRNIFPISLKQIVNCIAYVARPRQILAEDEFERTRRLSASAGALHAIEILFFLRKSPNRLYRYDALNNVLQLIAVRNKNSIAKFLSNSSDVLPEANGGVIVLLADMEKIASAYDNPLSLILRDAGALLQTLHLVAEGYGLGFCQMGILGNEIIEGIFEDEATQKRFLAVGTASIGNKANSTHSGS